MAESAALVDQAPDLSVIRAARERIRGWVRRTPVLSSAALDQLCGSRLFF